jgi:hypothetical protein
MITKKSQNGYNKYRMIVKRCRKKTEKKMSGRLIGSEARKMEKYQVKERKRPNEGKK